MKKIFAIAMLGLVLASCKKTDSGTNNNNNNNGGNNNNSNTDTSGNHNSANDTVAINTVQATINGATSTYSVITGEGTVPSTYTGTGLSIGALDGTNWQTADAFSVNITANHTIVPGTYTMSDTSIVYFQYLQQGGDIEYTSLATTPNNILVTLTAVGAHIAKGTFSGSVYLNSSPTATPVVVTNGKFYMTF